MDLYVMLTFWILSTGSEDLLKILLAVIYAIIRNINLVNYEITEQKGDGAGLRGCRGNQRER